MTAAVLEVRGLVKRYGPVEALKGIDLTVSQGSIYGFIGPNGAGKTTTIRMIMNITIPGSGRVLILGRPSTDGASRLVGYLPEERGLYRRMKVLDHIVFLGEIRGIEQKEAKKRASEWLERVKLTK